MSGRRIKLGRESLPLVPVLLAAVVIVIRAVTQSITIDEASAFEAFVNGGPGLLLQPSSANHVLYSLLEYLAVNAFGLHVFVLRLPALLGAAMYLGAGTRIVTSLTSGTVPRLAFLAALALNPLTMDYLIAARGYSLALGFLMVALAAMTELLLRDHGPRGRPVALHGVASAALGAGVAANFSFAVVDVAIGALFIGLVVTRQQLTGRRLASFAGVMIVPGSAVLALVCGDTLIHWPGGQFVYGANTFGGMLRSVVDTSVHELNSNVLQQPLLGVMRVLADLVPYVLLGCLALVVASLSARRRVAQPKNAVVGLMLGAAVTGLVVHLLLRAVAGLLLREARTASWLVPLVLIGLIAAASGEREAPRCVARFRPVTCGLALLAVVELACLRTGYFQEWPFDATTNVGFHLMETEATRLGVKEPVVDWHFNSSFTFYRDQLSRPFVGPIAGDFSYPPGRRLYVLYQPSSEAFLAQERLSVVYLDRLSGLEIAEDGADAAGYHQHSERG